MMLSMAIGPKGNFHIYFSSVLLTVLYDNNIL